MHPILFEFGPIRLYTYGLFVALGIVFAIYFARREARRYGMDPDRIMDLCFYLVLAAIVGSRLFYVSAALQRRPARGLETVLVPLSGVWVTRYKVYGIRRFR